MLQKLNERIQGIIAWVVIVFIALTFMLFGVDYYIQSKGSNQDAVKVNGQPITNQQWDLTFRRTRQQRDPSQLSSISEKQLKKQVLDEMIVNQVSVQAAKNTGFYVSSVEADAAIINIPQFQEDGQFSATKYQQAISSALYTSESFQKQVQQGMLLNQQRFAFIGSAFALPSEIDRFVKLYMQTRDFQYLLIPSSLFIKETNVTNDEVNQYYLNHKRDFLSKEQISIDYIELSLNKIKDDIKIEDISAKRYYDDNKGSYLSPASWQVAHILFSFPIDGDEKAQLAVATKANEVYKTLINKPEQFNSWVQKVSDDKLSITDNGLLPWITAGDNELDVVLSSMKSIGSISRPVKTSRGYEIFKLIASKPASLKPFSQVEQQIKTQLKNEQAQTQYMQLLEQLSDLSYQTPDSLTGVAEQLKLDIQHSKPFTRLGGDVALTKNPQVINAAFSHDVLDLGNNSEPVQVDANTVLVLRVNQHIPEKEMPLTMVENTIKQQLAQEKAKSLSQAFGQMLIARIQNHKSYEAFIKDKKLNWVSVSKSTRDSDKAPSLINDLAFSLPSIGVEQGKMLANGDFVIVKLTETHPGQLSQLDNEQQTNLEQQIESSYGMMDYDLYINQLMKNAKIERTE